MTPKNIKNGVYECNSYFMHEYFRDIQVGLWYEVDINYDHDYGLVIDDNRGNAYSMPIQIFLDHFIEI